MVMTPRGMEIKLMKMRMELALLKMKEKYLGRLSDADQKRKNDLLRKLVVKY